MKQMQKRSLPQIPERRLKTQQAMNFCRSNNHKMRRFTYNLKQSISNNEYLRNWLQKDQQRQKMKKIFIDAHNANSRSKINSMISSKKASSIRKKDALQWRFNSDADQPISEATIQPNIIKQPKLQLKEPVTDEVHTYYNLEIKRGQPSKQKLRNFCLILQQRNIFFQKMSRVINQTLLNIGVVNNYSVNDYVYKEAFPIKNIGIILWGSVVLKYKKCKAKFYCGAGNTIGEQVIFEKIDYNSKRFSTVQNGKLFTNQRCKVVQDCGILFVGEKEYSYMHEDLVKWGFKDQIMRFQNILHRNYFKKRQFKSLMN